MQAQSPDFESIKQVNAYGEERWSARDLAPLLGYNKWERFEGAIKRAIIACEKTGSSAEQHFPRAGKTSPMPHGGVKEITDYTLSRFACYLIAQNGDPRKSQIAAAQVYFAVSTRTHEIEQVRIAQEERLGKRLKVSESYKSLASAATNAGVESAHMGIFMDAGNLGLYEHTLEELKEKKGISEQEEYLDRIGSRELSAVDFKNTLATGKLQDDHVIEEDHAIDTHYQAGQVVREAIEKMKQPLPETLPTEPSIRKLVEERRRKQKRSRSIRPADEQERLF